MASKAHVFFCFEVLAASFEKLPHPDLQTLLDLYSGSASSQSDHVADNKIDSTRQTALPPSIQSPPQLPSLSRLQAQGSAAQSPASSSPSTSVNSSTSHLTGSTSTDLTDTATYASQLSITQSYPLFVTWNAISRSGNKSLRGCIGTFEALPLEDGLKQYALTSAFQDTRFSPIPSSLLPNLACSLTLLADFEECSHALDWLLGTHGVRISFTNRHRRYGATYLPDVAVEQGWTKEETLESLMRKAGYDSGSHRMKGRSQPWEEVTDFRVVRYTGLKASGSYSEWQSWRNMVGLA